jgi:hypothetical protein
VQYQGTTPESVTQKQYVDSKVLKENPKDGECELSFRDRLSKTLEANGIIILNNHVARHIDFGGYSELFETIEWNEALSKWVCVTYEYTVDCCWNISRSPLPTMLEGDLIVNGKDGVKRQIVFNEDGTCTWTAV